MASDFRILVLGPQGSGKTSLITGFLKDAPCHDDDEAGLPARLPVVSVPGLYGGTLYIVDGSELSGEQDESRYLSWIDTQIDRADAVILVYSLADAGSLEKLKKQWIPRIRNWHKSKANKTRYTPIVVAANKLDERATGDSDTDSIVECKDIFTEIFRVKLNGKAP